MLLIVYGTRPEYIKVKSIIENIGMPYKVLFTGQHENIAPESSLRLEIIDGENRLDSIVQSCLNNNDIFENITHVLVQGDTSSAFSLALAAFHRGVKIIHLEAGLRTYDKLNPYPEETNRKMISALADIHLCPTISNKENLINEKIEGEIFVVGNTGLDNIDKGNITYNNKILITLHRRENHHLIEEYFSTISKLATDNKDLEFVIPLHPNPNVRKHKNKLKNINVVEPMEHNEIINLIRECKFVISDSGGLQEECSFLNKKIIVCRKVTERPETIGVNSYMCENPNNLINLFNKINSNCEVSSKCPYGNGESYKLICVILNKLLTK